MNLVALKMLTGDRAKYLALVFAIAFATFLMSHQSSVLAGIMRRTESQILDVVDASVWVMDAETLYIDENRPLRSEELYRVRGVAGVAWAVPLYKGQSRAKSGDGRFRAVILMGLDDQSLVGGPPKMIAGSVDNLREPGAVIVDKAGYVFFFPGQPLALGRTLELDGRRVHIAGICDSSAPFLTLPVFYSRYSEAIASATRERNAMSFILVRPARGVSDGEICARIRNATGLAAFTGEDFGWKTLVYYGLHTGIPLNFGITIAIALAVGTVVTGQTFYLFTLENLKHFGSLKAVGVTNVRLTGMILLQALLVCSIGSSIGIALTAAFFVLTNMTLDLRGFFLPWQIAVGVVATALLITVAASLLSIRRVLVLEPATVLRG